MFRCGYGAAAAAKAATRTASSGRGSVSRAGRVGAAREARGARGAKAVRAAKAARARGGAPRGAAVTCRRGTPAVFALPRASQSRLHPLKMATFFRTLHLGYFTGIVIQLLEETTEVISDRFSFLYTNKHFKV